MAASSRGWCWLWIALAFLLGTIFGVVGCLALLIAVQAMISYPG
ncbi:MAG: hypothetical protein U0872_09605 [Planctomycetaceae bacterium]